MSRANPPEPRLERRERRRFPVRLMLDVHCGKGESRKAVSRDASEAGISFFCDTGIPAGSPIEFNVHVPESVAEQERVFVRGSGKVVRSERQSLGRFLIAAVTDGYRFNE